MKLLKISFLVLVLASCKAQQPSFVGLGKVSAESENYDKEFVEWYNKLVVSPIVDTVSLFVTPKFSDLRYVMITPLDPTCSVRVESSDGKRFYYNLTEGYFYFDQVAFNEDGEVISGLKDIMLTGCKLRVQYERCPECKFSKTKSKL